MCIRDSLCVESHCLVVRLWSLSRLHRRRRVPLGLAFRRKPVLTTRTGATSSSSLSQLRKLSMAVSPSNGASGLLSTAWSFAEINRCLPTIYRCFQQRFRDPWQRFKSSSNARVFSDIKRCPDNVLPRVIQCFNSGTKPCFSIYRYSVPRSATDSIAVWRVF